MPTRGRVNPPPYGGLAAKNPCRAVRGGILKYKVSRQFRSGVREKIEERKHIERGVKGGAETPTLPKNQNREGWGTLKGKFARKSGAARPLLYTP